MVILESPEPGAFNTMEWLSQTNIFIYSKALGENDKIKNNTGSDNDNVGEGRGGKGFSTLAQDLGNRRAVTLPSLLIATAMAVMHYCFSERP